MRRFLYVLPCAAVAWTLWTCLVALFRDDFLPRKSRVPLSADEVACIPSGIDAFPEDFLSQEQRVRGGVVVHVLVVCYVCAMLALVCDDHFVPALEAIVKKLNLSPDVAGATFMAMGASAPELFSSIAGSFVTEDDIGLGTILGSAVFNILGISGIVGMVLWNRSLSIRRYPVLRDCVVYTATVVVLTLVILDNVVQWWEALLLVGIFCSYILFMHFNARIEDGVKRCIRRKDPEKESLLDEEEAAPPKEPDASGKGNMAISNLLGSNTFDLAFCLGAPWLAKTLLSGRGRLLVYSSAMIYTASTLLVSLVALLVTFQLNDWKLDKISGMVCFGLYVGCITLACLYELNVFGEINKPTCS